jgi:hypothetical protein
MLQTEGLSPVWILRLLSIVLQLMQSIGNVSLWTKDW